MKRVDILTFWGVPNYGAFAQAYALNKLISRLSPDAVVEHIAYLHPEHQALYFRKKRPALTAMKDIINPFFYLKLLRYAFNKERQYPNFEKDWDLIPHIDISSEKNLEQYVWDTVITGSDAIWEYSIKAFGDDVHLIGNSLHCKRLYSYAASFGEMDINDYFPDFVVNGLEKYNQISVRDDVSKNIVKKLTGREAEVVLDPTLLYDFKNDNMIPVSKYENYILVYGNNFSEKMITEVKEYARKNNLEIIGAGLAPEWCDKQLLDIGPLEWIGMFAKAEFVVTCTFHGLMFSINYNKKVLFNQVAYTVNRSNWLLKKLELDSLFEKDVSLEKVLEYSWNYKDINKRLDELREASRSFLLQVLADE